MLAGATVTDYCPCSAGTENSTVMSSWINVCTGNVDTLTKSGDQSERQRRADKLYTWLHGQRLRADDRCGDVDVSAGHDVRPNSINAMAIPVPECRTALRLADFNCDGD